MSGRIRVATILAALSSAACYASYAPQSDGDHDAADRGEGDGVRDVPRPEATDPDHRGAYRVWVAESRMEGECGRWSPAMGASGHAFVSVGDPGVVEVWQALVAPPGPGRFEGTIAADGSRATFEAGVRWSCCTHSLSGVFPDSRSIEATLEVREDGFPECRATFMLLGMRDDVPCSEDLEPDACFRAGGIYAYVGPVTGELCSCPTFDGHETCALGSDCEGACMADPAGGGGCAGIASGHCTTGHRWSGCYCRFESGPPDGPICWN